MFQLKSSQSLSVLCLSTMMVTNPDFSEGVAKGAEWLERSLAKDKRLRWRRGALKVQPTVQKRLKWRELPISKAAVNALQRMVDEITDTDFIIQHIQKYYPECIVDDDGSEVKLNLRKLNSMQQQQLAKYIGHIRAYERHWANNRVEELVHPRWMSSVFDTPLSINGHC